MKFMEGVTNDDLIHYGRKGMKWYQSIYGSLKEGYRSRRTASRMAKIANIKEKARVVEERYKAEQAKANAAKQLATVRQQTKEIVEKDKRAAKERKQAIKERARQEKIERAKAAASAKEQKNQNSSTSDAQPKSLTGQMSARAVAMKMGSYSDTDLTNALKRLQTEKAIRGLANEEAERAKSPLKKYLSKTSNALVDQLSSRAVGYATDKITKYVFGKLDAHSAKNKNSATENDSIDDKKKTGKGKVAWNTIPNVPTGGPQNIKAKQAVSDYARNINSIFGEANDAWSRVSNSTAPHHVAEAWEKTKRAALQIPWDQATNNKKSSNIKFVDTVAEDVKSTPLSNVTDLSVYWKK